MKQLTKRLLIAGAAGVLLLLLLVAFRTPILRGMGNFLITADAPVHCDAVAVLGGYSFERAPKAIELVNAGLTNHVLCTGGNVPSAFLAIDTVITEARLTKDMLIRGGIDAGMLSALESSTSTMEESQEIRAWCDARDLDTLGVISSAFHLRRVRMVFEEAFAESEIEVVYIAANPIDYETDQWWKSEQGLIMVNNEYMKYLYYVLKY
jgi:uncharacterized SAM-binding protein YcdF (DUF218 family)